MPKNKGRETQNAAVIKSEWLFRDKNAVSQLNQSVWLYLLEFHAYEVAAAVSTADAFQSVVSHANVNAINVLMLMLKWCSYWLFSNYNIPDSCQCQKI